MTGTLYFVKRVVASFTSFIALSPARHAFSTHNLELNVRCWKNARYTLTAGGLRDTSVFSARVLSLLRSTPQAHSSREALRMVART